MKLTNILTGMALGSMTMVLAYSCGTTSKVGATASKHVATPSAAQADSLMSALASPAGEFRTFVLGEEDASKVYGFIPVKDSASVKVATLAPVKGEWTLESLVNYPDGESGYGFSAFADSCSVVEMAGVKYFTFSHLRTQDSSIQKSVNIYRPDLDSFQQVCFTGKKLADGKIEGTSNEKFIIGAERPELRYVIAKLHADDSLVFLSEADMMTDQAIQWWISRNPKALTGTTKITFGQLDKESSLVAAYQGAKKENLDAYRAATFNIRGYTVVVSFNKSTGNYALAWAEPICKNKKTDRYLNSIYQASGNVLSMFYYKGNTTFKNNLNLANGTLQKR